MAVLPCSFPDLAELDRAVSQRDALRPLERLLHRVAVDDVEAAHHFPRLGERPVADDPAAGRRHPDGLRLAWWAEPMGPHEFALRPQLLPDDAVALEDARLLGGRHPIPFPGDVGEHQQESHVSSSLYPYDERGPEKDTPRRARSARRRRTAQAERPRPPDDLP